MRVNIRRSSGCWLGGFIQLPSFAAFAIVENVQSFLLIRFLRPLPTDGNQTTEEERQQAVKEINARGRLGFWTAAIGLIPLSLDAILAPMTAGIPVINLGYRLFRAIASWRRAVKLAKDEDRLLTPKARVMFDSAEILGGTIIHELHEQLERAPGDQREYHKLKEEEKELSEFLDDQVMRTRRLCYSNKPEHEKKTKIAAIIGGLLNMQMRLLLIGLSERSQNTRNLFNKFEEVKRKLGEVRSSTIASNTISIAVAGRSSPADSVAVSQGSRRSNTNHSSRFASSAVIPPVPGISSGLVRTTESQTSTSSSIRSNADLTDIDETVAHCHELAIYCLKELPP